MNGRNRIEEEREDAFEGGKLADRAWSVIKAESESKRNKEKA